MVFSPDILMPKEKDKRFPDERTREYSFEEEDAHVKFDFEKKIHFMMLGMHYSRFS